MDYNKEIEIKISDAIVESPIHFNIGWRNFRLYPPTLGKMQILKKLYFSMEEADTCFLSVDPVMASLELCYKDPYIISRIIAYSTFRDKKNILNTKKVFRRAKLFQRKLSATTMSLLLHSIFSLDKVDEFIHYFGLDAEKKMKAEVNEVKGESNSITFGGKGIYGLLIDFACQRYGWTMDYVLWGISYVNLNMLFADAITTVYLSDEERKKLGRGWGKVIDAGDPRNRELVRKMISE